MIAQKQAQNAVELARRIIPSAALRSEDLAGFSRGRIYASVQRTGGALVALLHHELNEKTVFAESVVPGVSLESMRDLYDMRGARKSFANGHFRRTVLSTSMTGQAMDGGLEWKYEPGKPSIYITAVATSTSPDAKHARVFQLLLEEVSKVAQLLGRKYVAMHSETMKPLPLSRLGFYQINFTERYHYDKQPFFVKELPQAEAIQ